ncbi:hypothetical protein JCM8208_001245 [Rhodotorula glutinis]
MSVRGAIKLELVKVELERGDGSLKRWSIGITDRTGERRSYEDIKREVANLVRPPLTSFTLVCTSPSPLFGCGITSSCWDAVEDGAVLRVELDEPVPSRDVGLEARGRSVKAYGGSRGEYDERQGSLLPPQAAPGSPDCISTPTSSSSCATNCTSSYLSAIDSASSSPHSTTDTYRTASNSPRLPLSPPHSLPGSRRSSLAFDSHASSMIAISSRSSSASSRPALSRSRSTTPAPGPRHGTTPSDSPGPRPSVEQVFGTLEGIFALEHESPGPSRAHSDASRSPREARSPVVEDVASASAASASTPSSAHLARQASFEDALRVRLVAEPRVRSSRSTASLSSSRRSSPASSRPVSPARALLPSIASLSMTQRPSSPRLPPPLASSPSPNSPDLDGARSTSRSRSAHVRFAAGLASSRPPTPAKSPYASPPSTPGLRPSPMQAPWVPLRSPSISASSSSGPGSP